MTDDLKELKFSGDWRITVVSTESSQSQRVSVKGATADATLAGTPGKTMDVVGKPDTPWSLKIQARKDGSTTWVDSLLKVTAEGVQAGRQFRVIGSEDGTDNDFDDLVIRVDRPVDSLFVPQPPVLEIPQGSHGIGIRAQLLDGDGKPVPLPSSGSVDVKFILAWSEVTPFTMIRAKANPGIGRVVDAAKGIVGYVTEAGDFDRVGRYRGEFWIDTGTEVFAFPVAEKLDIRVVKTVDRI
jgi:hypothetical protein